ncbi:hypothetical protein JH06_1356 [Blastocystis sp. subtype 4]|uniref:hypothetical protein n=1 Tax=Blastocystis sp. subtype 4 TaxID=944170 RepID=UPI00071216F5|nr:hypothetical protein JH06_1356 [Blastocystis sp. subtype 4]KNB45752.1 hypothetical protein JH06_1356 [Blastocystis sp. subtype 4]|eukprot:XP_014529195.1 hypothetical protein JH06_1356 [Blastocystis sp. subtype 4]
MPEQRQPEQEEQEQPRMNFLTMLMIFFLIRNLMSGFTNPKPQESPASIIENYNQSLKTQDTQSAVEPTGPVSSIFGLMKGMMPIKKGENGATYVSTLKDGDLCSLYVYLSETNNDCSVNDDSLIYKREKLHYGTNLEYNELNVTLPMTENLLNNGTLYAHIFFGMASKKPSECTSTMGMTHTIYQLNRYKPNITAVEEVNLLSNASSLMTQKSQTPPAIISYWVPMLHMYVIPNTKPIRGGQIPPQMKDYFIDDETHTFTPNADVNEFKHLMPINDTLTELPLALSFKAYGFFKGQMVQQMDTVLEMQKMMGAATEDDFDDIKSMFLETNIYLLILTGIVSTLHSVFDALAFKNEISFWRNRNNMEGLSVRSVFMNVFVNLIVLLYLINNETSTMIIISNAVGLLIELWKITKAVKIRFYWKNNKPVLRIRDRATYSTSKTKEYDDTAMRHLMVILYPLVAGYAIYSLIYETHKSWYDWIITSLTNFVYLFGFISMTPQLFINYKLKSVAHIPMNAMIYKTLNTFIDDMFSFIIKMPVLHRIACFRDDIIFFIYLYQMWIYPVDKTRKNEFGYSALDLQKAQKKGDEKAIVQHRSKTERLAF